MVCFWKFCRAFEGPHNASAMPVDCYEVLGVFKRGGIIAEAEMMVGGNEDQDG